LKGLLGLIPGRNEGKYYHKLRGHIANFATALYMCIKRGVSASNEVLEIINRLPKKKAILKLELLTLKALRITYLMTTKTLADG
jgi:hypothetical protein